MNEEDYELADADGSVSGQYYTYRYCILSSLKRKSFLKTGMLLLFLLLLLSLMVICKIESANSEYFKIWHFSHHKETVWLFSKCAGNNVVQLIARFDLLSIHGYYTQI